MEQRRQAMLQLHLSDLLPNKVRLILEVWRYFFLTKVCIVYQNNEFFCALFFPFSLVFTNVVDREILLYIFSEEYRLAILSYSTCLIEWLAIVSRYSFHHAFHHLFNAVGLYLSSSWFQWNNNHSAMPYLYYLPSLRWILPSSRVHSKESGHDFHFIWFSDCNFCDYFTDNWEI